MAEEHVTGGSGSGRGMTWVRRSEVPPFSPAPGIEVRPVIGESLMTCWISMEPGAVVAEHSHPNEQLGVVIEGSVAISAAGETREMLVPYNAAGTDAAPMAEFTAACKQRGVWPFTHFNRVHVAPPLVIAEDELVRGLDVIDRALSAADEYVSR